LISHSSSASAAFSSTTPTSSSSSSSTSTSVYPATNLNGDACSLLETAALEFFQQAWPVCPRETKTGGLLGLFRRSQVAGPGSPLSAKSAVSALSDLSSPKKSLLFSPTHTPTPSNLAFPIALPSSGQSNGQDASIIAAEIIDKQLHMHTRLSELWTVLMGLLSVSPIRAAAISQRFISAAQSSFRQASDAARPARIIRGLMCVRLDISSADNLVTSQRTLSALVAFFKGKKSGSRGKGRKTGKSNGAGTSQMRRALSMVIHNMLWPLADQLWHEKLNYTEWQSLLLSLLKSAKTWLAAKPKADNARLAAPLITSVLCACARDYFLIEYASVLDKLIGAYQEPLTRTIAAACVQRLLHVYLTKMTDRRETTLACLEQLTQQLLLRGTLPVPRNKGASALLSGNSIGGSMGSQIGASPALNRTESETDLSTPSKTSKKEAQAFILGDAVPSLVSIILTAASSFSTPSPTSTPLLLRFASKQMCAALLAHICIEEKKTKGQVEMVTEHDLVGLAALSAMLRNVVFSDDTTTDASNAATVAHKSRRISIAVSSRQETKSASSSSSSIPSQGNSSRIGGEAGPDDEDEIEAAPPALLVPSSEMILASLRDNVREVVTDALRHGEPLVETEVADTVWRVLSRCWPAVSNFVMSSVVPAGDALSRRTITVRALAEAMWCVPAVWPLWSLDTGAQVINMLVSALIHEHAGVREASSWALQQLIIGGGQSITSGDDDDDEVKLDVGRRNELRSRIVAEIARSVCAMKPPMVSAVDQEQTAFTAPVQRLLHHCNALLQLWIRAQASDEASTTLSIRDSANIESAALVALCTPHPPTRLRALEVLASVDALAVVVRPSKPTEVTPAPVPSPTEATENSNGDSKREDLSSSSSSTAAPLTHAPTHVSMFAAEARTISVLGVMEYAESLMVVPNGAYTSVPSTSLSSFLANRSTGAGRGLASIARIRSAACGAPQTTAAGEAAREDNWGITWAHVLRCLVAAATQRGGLPQMGNAVDIAISRLDMLTQHLRPHIIATPKSNKKKSKKDVASSSASAGLVSPVRPSKLANRNGGAPGFKTPTKKKSGDARSPNGGALPNGTQLPEAIVECRWRNYALLATIGSLCISDEETEDTAGRRVDVSMLIHELMTSSSIEARSIASTVMGRVHRSGMETALSVLKGLQMELSSVQAAKNVAVRISKDYMRPHMAHVYELLAQRLTSQDLTMGSTVREPFTSFIKDTLGYLWQEDHEFNWSLQSLRISLCTLVLGITKLLDPPPITSRGSFSSIASQPASASSASLTSGESKGENKKDESGVSSQLRKALFNLLLPWCGHGPDSREFIAKIRSSFDNHVRAGVAQAIPFHSSMRPLHDGALQAMVAVVRGKCFDEELEEQVTKNGGTSSNDTSPVLSWINALLASPTPAIRHVGADALASLIQNNQWLLPALLNYCYSTSLEVSRRYYLVVGAMFLANGIATGETAKHSIGNGLYLPMPSLLLLVLYKLSDPSSDVRAMSLQLLPKLSSRGAVNSAVSSDLRDTYTHTQTQLSKRVAAEHGPRYARILIGEGAYRVQMLRDPFQRHDVLRLLVPWMAHITLRPLSSDHTGIAARKMFRTLMELSKFCAHSPSVLEQLWQALAAGHVDNAQHVLDFFLDPHHGLASFDGSQLEGAKQIVVHLSRARPWITLSSLATALFVPGSRDTDATSSASDTSASDPSLSSSLSSHHRTASQPQPAVAALLSPGASSTTPTSSGASPPRSSSPGRSPSRSSSNAVQTTPKRETKDDISVSPTTVTNTTNTTGATSSAVNNGSALTSSAALRRPSYALMLLVEAVYELQLHRLIPPSNATSSTPVNALVGSVSTVRDLIGLLLHMGALGLQSAQSIVRGQSARLLLNLIHALLTNTSNAASSITPEPLWAVPGSEVVDIQPHSIEATRVMSRLMAMQTECDEGTSNAARGRKFSEEEVGSVIGDLITVVSPAMSIPPQHLAQGWAELALACTSSPALTARSFHVYRLLPLGLGIARGEHIATALAALDHCLRGHNAHVAATVNSGGRSPQLPLLIEMLYTVQSMVKGVATHLLTVELLARSLWSAVSLLWSELVIHSNPALSGSTGVATISNPAVVEACLSLVDAALDAIPRERSTFVEEVMALMPSLWPHADNSNLVFSGLQPLLLRSLPLFTPSRTLNGPSLSSVCTLLAKMTALPFGTLIDGQESTRLAMALTALVPWFCLHAHQLPDGAEDDHGKPIVNKDIRPSQITTACAIIATRCELAGLTPIARAVRRLQRGHYASAVRERNDGPARAFMVDVLVPLCRAIEPQCVGTVLAMLTGLLPRPVSTMMAASQPTPNTPQANMEFRYHTHVLSLLSGVVGLADWHWLTLPVGPSAMSSSAAIPIVTPSSPAPARPVASLMASPAGRPVRLPPPINGATPSAAPVVAPVSVNGVQKVATFFPFFRIIGSLLQSPLRGHASLLLDAALARGAGLHRRSSSVVSQALRATGGVIPVAMPTTPRSRASINFGMPIAGPRPSFASPAPVASGANGVPATPAPILFSPTTATPHHGRERTATATDFASASESGSSAPAPIIDVNAPLYPSLPRSYSVVITPPSPKSAAALIEDSKEEANMQRPMPVFQPVDQITSDAHPPVSVMFFASPAPTPMPQPSAPGLPVAVAMPMEMPPSTVPTSSTCLSPPVGSGAAMSPGRSPNGVTSPGRTPKRHVRISSLEWMNDLGSPEQPEAETHRRKSREAIAEHESAIKRKISQDLGEFDEHDLEHQQLVAALTMAADNAQEMEQQYPEAGSGSDGDDTTDDEHDDNKSESESDHKRRSSSSQRRRRRSSIRARQAVDAADDNSNNNNNNGGDDQPRLGRSVSVFHSPPPRPPKPTLTRGMSFSHGTPSGGLLSKGGYSQPFVAPNGAIVFAPNATATSSSSSVLMTPEGRVVSFASATQNISSNDIVSVGAVQLASPSSQRDVQGKSHHGRTDSVDIAERAKQLKSLLVSPLAPEPRPRPLIRSPSPQPGAPRHALVHIPSSPQPSSSASGPRASQFAQSPQGAALSALLQRSPTVPGQHGPEPQTLALLVQSAREAAARRKANGYHNEDEEKEQDENDENAPAPAIPGVRLSRPKVSGRKKRITNARKWQAQMRKSLEKGRPPGASSIVIVSNGSNGQGSVRVTVSPQPPPYSSNGDASLTVSPQSDASQSGGRLPLSPRAPQYHTQLPTPPKPPVTMTTPSKALNGLSSHPYAAMYGSPAPATPKSPRTPVTPDSRRRSDVFVTPPERYEDIVNKENVVHHRV
jgi:hypothetical protein